MKYFSHYMEKETTELFKTFKCFYAFSVKQFLEKYDENVVYAKLHNNLFCPKKDADFVLLKLDLIYEKAIRQDVKENGKENIIKRELSNHESYYTGNIDDAVESLSKYNYSYEEILNVYHKNYETETANY